MPNDAAQNADARDPDSVEDWLRSLLPLKGLGASAQQVFNLIVREPAKASFLPAAELADLAQTSVSSVTRAAQRVGYSGWPDFQRDLRARHIAHLSVLEVSDAHADGGSPFQASLRQDADSLSVSLRKTDDGKIVEPPVRTHDQNVPRADLRDVVGYRRRPVKELAHRVAGDLDVVDKCMSDRRKASLGGDIDAFRLSKKLGNPGHLAIFRLPLGYRQ